MSSLTRRQQWLALRPWRRHSLVLLVAGIFYGLLGIAYIITPSTPARETALTIPLTLTDGSLIPWGLLFIGAGSLAVLSARWPPASETWGYTALTGMSTIWSSFFFTGMVINHFWHDQSLGKVSAGFTGFLIFAVFGFLWWAISGLRNPTDLPAPPLPRALLGDEYE